MSGLSVAPRVAAAVVVAESDSQPTPALQERPEGEERRTTTSTTSTINYIDNYIDNVCGRSEQAGAALLLHRYERVVPEAEDR